jgi:hypothetical protein
MRKPRIHGAFVLLLSIPASRPWPTSGPNVQLVEGQVYRYDQIAEYTWFDRGGRRHIAPDALFTYSLGDGGAGCFDEVVEESPFSLVSAEEALEDIAALRRRGFTMQDIARRAGISSDSADRAAAGSGVIRRSTRDAIHARPTASSVPRSTAAAAEDARERSASQLLSSRERSAAVRAIHSAPNPSNE